MALSNTTNHRLLNITTVSIATILFVYVLIVGRSILLPIVTAIVIWYLIIRLEAAFSEIPVLKIRIPYLIALLLAFIVTGLFLYGFGKLVSVSVNNIVAEVPQYQTKLNELLTFINNATHSKFNIDDLLSEINLTTIFSHLTLTITYLAGNLALIIVYVIFLLLEYKTFDNKLKVICRSEERYKTVSLTISRISKDINTYMKVKAGASLFIGVLSYLILIIFGVKNAEFWGLLIFLLNFIPTIGSIVAVVLTLLAVSIQFSSLPLYIIMACLLIAAQFIVGNFIEPKFMGKNLNLSPFIILIALAFWGSVWGILGMFLCVPLLTIINIILSKFESTRNIAVLFAANPEIVE